MLYSAVLTRGRRLFDAPWAAALRVWRFFLPPARSPEQVARTRWHSTDAAPTASDDGLLRGATAPRSADDSCLAGYRILVAEDSPDNQRMIRYLLQRGGAQVALVDNGQSAVDLALKEHRQGSAFDLILMDMQMPILDGYEATSHLRAAGYRQPIIALTAHALSTEHDECRAAGCDDVCTKPIERAAFFAAIRRRVGRREADQGLTGVGEDGLPSPSSHKSSASSGRHVV
ncbi:MAG TPA: response regulator [Pirellulales bacterium]|nr:response regulator [Pirellulales bacterium]